MNRASFVGGRAGRSIVVHGVVAGLMSAVAVTTAAWAIGDERTALSAGAGAGVVLGVMTVGLLAISAVVAADAALSMAGAGLVYLGQLILIVVALLLFRERGWLDGDAFAYGAIAQVLVMQVALVVGYVRGRHALDVVLAGHVPPGRSR